MSGHNHAHGACGHEHAEGGGHTHDHGEDEGGEAWALYEKIDTDRLICLNEKRDSSLKDVIRPWHQRLDTTLPTLESDTDEQLLMCIPFINPVKIKSIAILGAGDEENPAVMSAYVNQEVMDFSSTESIRPVQTWELTRRVGDGFMEYPTRYTKFQNVTKLWLFVSSNYGAATTEVMFIGFKGEFTKYRREPVETVYESRPLGTSSHVRDLKAPRMGM